MDAGDSQPIDSEEQLEGATPDLIRQQIRWQISRLRATHGLTQEQVGAVIGSDQSYASRIEAGTIALRVDHAKLLDGRWPGSGRFSFEGLAKARAKADGRTKRQHVLRRSVFVASPMSVPTDNYAASRNLAIDLVRVLRNHCSFDVYYAGENLHTVEDFDAADLAYEINLKALKEASHFILLWEGPPRENKQVSRSKTVSSIWVEAGMALTLNIPSTYFVPDLTALPYILQQASKQNSSAHVTVRPFDDDPHRAVSLVRSNGARLFYGHSGEVAN